MPPLGCGFSRRQCPVPGALSQPGSVPALSQLPAGHGAMQSLRDGWENADPDPMWFFPACDGLGDTQTSRSCCRARGYWIQLSSKEIGDLGYSHCSFSRRCLHHHFPVGISGASVDKVGSKQKLQLQTRQELLKLKKSRSKPIPPPHCLDGVKQHWGVKDSHPLFAIT